MIHGEQRRDPRLSVQQMRICNGLLTGQVVNLSRTGLAMESTTGLTIGSLHGFRITSAAATVRVEAEVRWCRLCRTVRRQAGEVLPIFRTGVTFTRAPTFPARPGLRSSGEWLDLLIRLPR